MRKKKISFGLSTKEINRAIKELEAEKKYITEKTVLLRERIAERIKEEAQNGFNGAIVDDIISEHGSIRNASVEVTVEPNGDAHIVIADGEDAVWVEFGAGVYHNGSVGSSPNPYGQKMGLTIGSYGKGNGKKEAWGYYNENQELIITRGTPAKMPLANAVTSVLGDIQSIAEEVFA